MSTTGWLRGGFGVLSASQVVVGIWALVFPSSFFADFPAGLGWVALLPPYNEHLTRDVGGLSLGFAVMFAATVVHPHRQLATVSLVGWLTAVVPHLVFHVTHLEGFDARDAVAQTFGLAIVVVIPILLLALIWRRRFEGEAVPGVRPHTDNNGDAGVARRLEQAP